MKKLIYYTAILFIAIVNYNCTKDDASITPSNIAPTSPKNLIALIDSTQGKPIAILNWEAPSNNGGTEIIQYIIYKGTSPNNLEIIKYIDSDSTTYRDIEITNTQNYYYAVTAKNEVGESSKSNVVNLTINQTYLKPSEPENFLNSSGDNEIFLIWNPPNSNGGASIVNYKIYKATSQNNFLLYKTLSPNLTSYIDSNVINFQLYNYRITASNFLYESDPSEIISASPNGIRFNSLKGNVTFVDTNFVLDGGVYIISAYPSTAWPPMSSPSAYDTIKITRSNNVLNLNYEYRLINLNPGQYVVSVGFRKNSGGQSPLMSIYGCDTARAIYPFGLTCLLNPSLRATIGLLNEGAIGINMISWSDTTKKIY